MVDNNNFKKLTQLSKRAGCAGKLTPEMLSEIFNKLENTVPKNRDENLLVGFDKNDDAAVYKVSEEIALVQTLDFFTPVVNDPFRFGEIAATNALSDVYAMGGKPLTALNISCFPPTVDSDTLAQILSGGLSKIQEAGAILAGGHTVTDDEIKYGLSVTGLINPSKVITNSGAKPGDLLILTKPIGIGVLSTALKIEFISEEEFEEASNIMATLNKIPSEEMQKTIVNACTDITGFGFIGHTYEMATGSDVDIIIDSSKVKIMDKVLDLIKECCVPSGAYSNEKHFSKYVVFDSSITPEQKISYYDPQTSGGLLISVPKEIANSLVDNINSKSKIQARIIGEVINKKENESRLYFI